MAKKGLAYSFGDTIAKLLATPPGKEAAMYGPLRDIFVNVLGYVPADVDIDTTGDAGRPDITVNVSIGLQTPAGVDIKHPWIVIEAKSDKGVFADPATREDIFAEKAKYIGANTAWFVMVDPTTWVARPVGGKVPEADTIISISATLDEEAFAHELIRLKAEVAGCSEWLKRFRAGDTDLIARFRVAAIALALLPSAYIVKMRRTIFACVSLICTLPVALSQRGCSRTLSRQSACQLGRALRVRAVFDDRSPCGTARSSRQSQHRAQLRTPDACRDRA